MSSEAQQSVNYEPLPRRAIRMLRLQPAKKLTAPLVGTLEVVSLDDELQYEALSYAWDGAFNIGDEHNAWVATLETMNVLIAPIPLPLGQMYLEGCLLSITGNLRDALRRLRHDSQTSLLWVDALCICQDDKPEQSAQVAIMADIYSAAKRVIVWLGEDSDDRDGELFFRLCRRQAERRNRTWRKMCGKMAWQVVRFYWKLGMDGEGYWTAQGSLGPMHCWNPKGRHEKMRAFARRRYFHRRWCIQELAVAKDLLVVCGANQMPWTQLLANINGLYLQGLYSDLPFRSIQEYRERPANALHILDKFSRLRCTNERDHIYALAALLRRDAHCPAIKIDYTLPWQQTYTSFVSDYLQVGSLSARWTLLMNAAFQCYWDGRLRSNELPSWVFDFRWPTHSRLHEESSIESDQIAIQGGTLEVHLVFCGKCSLMSADQKTKRSGSREWKDEDCLYSLTAAMFEDESRYDRYLALRPVADKVDTFRLCGVVDEFEEAEKTREAGEVHKVSII